MTEDDVVREVRCSLKVENGTVVFSIGNSGERLVIDPDTADQLAVDFRTAAIEARNGGTSC